MFTAEITIGNEYNTMSFDTREKALSFINSLLKNPYLLFKTNWNGDKLTGTASLENVHMPVAGEIYEGPLKQLKTVPTHRKVESADKFVIFEERIRIIVNDYHTYIDLINGPEENLDIPMLLKTAFQIWN